MIEDNFSKIKSAAPLITILLIGVAAQNNVIKILCLYCRNHIDLSIGGCIKVAQMGAVPEAGLGLTLEYCNPR